MSNIYILCIKIESDKYDIMHNCTSIHYSLEEAIEQGINDFIDRISNYYDLNYDDILEKDMRKFYNSKDVYYKFNVSVVSGNRKRFNTSKELMDYFNSNIDKISNNGLYDFLLSMVEYDDRFYDYKGKLQGSSLSLQCPKLQNTCSHIVDFSRESINRRNYYRFEYRIYEED